MRPADDSRLTQFLDDPARALWVLALPIMVGMGIHMVYTIVDLIFIGRLGGDAITAVAFNMPLYFVVMGLTMGLGSGVTAAIARAIGARDKQRADNSAEHGVVIGLVVAAFFMVGGLLFGRSLLSLLGTPDALLDTAWSYLHVLCWGMGFMVLSIIFRSILAGEGDMKLPMMIAGFGTLLNIVLDPLFIFVLDLGVRGAAMATVASQAVVFLVFIYMLFVREHAYVRFRLRDFKLSPALLGNILRIGVPASLAMLIMAFGQASLNWVLINYSPDTVAAYQIAGRIDMLIFLPVMAIANGLVTLVGMFHGAQRPDRVRYIVRYGLTRTVLITAAGSLVIYLTAPWLAAAFTSEGEIRSLVVDYLRIICFTYPLVAIAMPSGRIMQGLGWGTPMLVITSTRVLLLAAPLAAFFTLVLDKPVEWVWYAVVLSTLVAAIVGLLWMRVALRRTCVASTPSEAGSASLN